MTGSGLVERQHGQCAQPLFVGGVPSSWCCGSVVAVPLPIRRFSGGSERPWRQRVPTSRRETREARRDSFPASNREIREAFQVFVQDLGGQPFLAIVVVIIGITPPVAPCCFPFSQAIVTRINGLVRERLAICSTQRQSSVREMVSPRQRRHAIQPGRLSYAIDKEPDAAAPQPQTRW